MLVDRRPTGGRPCSTWTCSGLAGGRAGEQLEIRYSVDQLPLAIRDYADLSDHHPPTLLSDPPDPPIDPLTTFKIPTRNASGDP